MLGRNKRRGRDQREMMKMKNKIEEKRQKKETGRNEKEMKPPLCLSPPLLLIFPANHREPSAGVSSPRADLEIDLSCRSLQRFLCATE
jgi:hypothetical protein